jgi:hypothetical protein
LVQFVANSFDQNLVCANAGQIGSTLTARVPKAIKHGSKVTIKAKFLSESGFGVANVKVTLKLGKKKFSALTDASGIAKIKVLAPLKSGFVLIVVSSNSSQFYRASSFVSSSKIS